MKISVSKESDWREIKNAVAPIIQDLVENGKLTNDERESASETIVQAFVLAQHAPHGTSKCFYYYFSAIADFNTGVFEIYRKVGL